MAYEDDFVDDSEIMQYKGGIKDKARHTGFYLNAVRKALCLVDGWFAVL